jgi:hypothetical protein
VNFSWGIEIDSPIRAKRLYGKIGETVNALCPIIAKQLFLCPRAAQPAWPRAKVTRSLLSLTASETPTTAILSVVPHPAWTFFSWTDKKVDLHLLVDQGPTRSPDFPGIKIMNEIEIPQPFFAIMPGSSYRGQCDGLLIGLAGVIEEAFDH